MTQPLTWSLHGNDQLSGVLEKLDRTLAKLSRQLDGVTSDAKQMGRALGDTRAPAARATAGLDQVSSSASTTSDRLVSAIGKLKQWGATITIAVGLATAAAAGLGLKTAAANETAAISFEVLLGNAQRAQAFLQKLQAFAAATPFEMPQLRESASRLLAVGFEANRIIPILTRLGDATAGMGTGAEGISRAVYALGQMKQAGRVSLEEINQLTEAGIPALDALADHLGTTVAKLRDDISKGKIKPEDLFKAIEQGAGASFRRLNGMMDQQAQTLEGKWSTFKDALGQTLATAVEPALPGLKKSLDWVSTAIPAAFDKMRSMKGQVAEIFKGSDVPERLRRSLADMGERVLPFLKGAWDDILQTIRDNKEGLEALGRFISDWVIPVVGVMLVGAITGVKWAFQAVIWTLGHVVGAIRIMTEMAIASMKLILDAAVKSFGWVPGLGPKLREAQADFDKFANHVRSKLAAIDGMTIDINLKFHDAGYADYRAGERDPSGRASGGPAWAGESYDVGEMGRERFRPSVSGSIQTASSVASQQASMAGGGDQIIGVLRVVHETPDGEVIREELLAFKRRRGLRSLGFEAAT